MSLRVTSCYAAIAKTATAAGNAAANCLGGQGCDQLTAHKASGFTTLYTPSTCIPGTVNMYAHKQTAQLLLACAGLAFFEGNCILYESVAALLFQ